MLSLQINIVGSSETETFSEEDSVEQRSAKNKDGAPGTSETETFSTEDELYQNQMADPKVQDEYYKYLASLSDNE